MSIGTWWVWIAAALVLGILEVIVPGYILLGFALGAAVTGGLLFFAGGTALTWPVLLVIFAIASLVCWIGLRRYFSLRTGTVRNFDHDINEN